LRKPDSAIVTVLGFVLACVQPRVTAHLGEFLRSLIIVRWPANFDTKADTGGLLAATTFAGLGGFWTLFYSYWLRDASSIVRSTAGR